MDSNTNPPKDQIEENKNQFAIDIKNVVVERPKKNFVKGFFGGDQAQEYKVLQDENEEIVKSSESEGEDDEEISPISPVKGKAMTEEDRIDKVHDLDIRQRLLFAKIKSTVEKIDNLDKKDEILIPSDKGMRKFNTLRKELDVLQTKSDNIIAIKEQLEIQAMNSVKKKDQGLQESPEIRKPIDYGAKIKSSKRKLLMHKLQLKILELFRKITHQKVDDLEKEAEIGSMDQLDSDAYLFSSMVLEYLIFFLAYGLVIIMTVTTYMIFHFIVLIIQTFAMLFGLTSRESLDQSFKLAKDILVLMIFVVFQIVFILLFFQILFFPGILVVVTQIYCVSNLSNVTYTGDSETSYSLMVLKQLMVVFFFFLSMKEISSAADAIAYHYKRTFTAGLWCILFPIRMTPQLLQMVMTFWFCYINIYLIAQVNDTTDLIQNFAALAIVLEFDNYVMSFLRYMRFYTLYNKFLEMFGDEEHKKKKITKAQKTLKIQELVGAIKEHEIILKSMRDERRESKTNSHTMEGQEGLITKAKEKLEKFKKKNPRLTITGSQMMEGQKDKKQELNEFWQILHSIVDENIIRTAIIFLGKQEAIKVMLSKEQFPIDVEFKLSKAEKMFFNWFALVTVMTGILVITLVFLAYN